MASLGTVSGAASAVTDRASGPVIHNAFYIAGHDIADGIGYENRVIIGNARLQTIPPDNFTESVQELSILNDSIGPAHGHQYLSYINYDKLYAPNATIPSGSRVASSGLDPVFLTKDGFWTLDYSLYSSMILDAPRQNPFESVTIITKLDGSIIDSSVFSFSYNAFSVGKVKSTGISRWNKIIGIDGTEGQVLTFECQYKFGSEPYMNGFTGQWPVLGHFTDHDATEEIIPLEIVGCPYLSGSPGSYTFTGVDTWDFDVWLNIYCQAFGQTGGDPPDYGAYGTDVLLTMAPGSASNNGSVSALVHHVGIETDFVVSSGTVLTPTASISKIHVAKDLNPASSFTFFTRGATGELDLNLDFMLTV